MPRTERRSSPYLPARTAGDARLYLTFDDGPDPRWTPAILDLLAVHGVHATFFVVGRAAQQAPDLVRRIVADGHRLGNHSFSHRHPWKMLSRAARAEVRDGAAAIADISGQAPADFRPPHGRLRRCMLDEASAAGQRTVLWNVSAIDWGPLGTSAGIAARLQTAEGGDVVLMHDGQGRLNHPGTLLQVLPGFLAKLPERGLQAALLPSRFQEPV